MKPVKTLSDMQKMRTMCLCKGLRYALIYDFGTLCGLRVSDILKLKVSDVAYPTMTITETKTKNVRELQLPKKMQKDLKSYIKYNNLKPKSYLFYSHQGAGKHHIPITRQQVYEVMTDAAKSAGIENHGTHGMRKTYAYRHYKRSKSVKALQADFGHKYASTTMLNYLTEFFPVK